MVCGEKILTYDLGNWHEGAFVIYQTEAKEIAADGCHKDAPPYGLLGLDRFHQFPERGEKGKLDTPYTRKETDGGGTVGSCKGAYMI